MMHETEVNFLTAESEEALAIRVQEYRNLAQELGPNHVAALKEQFRRQGVDPKFTAVKRDIPQ
jgi:hypothetical protein